MAESTSSAPSESVAEKPVEPTSGEAIEAADETAPNGPIDVEPTDASSMNAEVKERVEAQSEKVKAATERVKAAAEKVKSDASAAAKAETAKASETVQQKTSDVAEAAQSAKEASAAAVKTAKEKSSEAAQVAKEKSAEAAKAAKEKSSEAAKAAKEKSAEAAKAAKAKVAKVAESFKSDTQTAPENKETTAKKAVDSDVSDAQAPASSEAEKEPPQATPVFVRPDGKPVKTWDSVKHSWLTYYTTHRNGVVYGISGGIIGVCILLFGFWPVLLIVGTSGVGLAYGQYRDGDPRIVSFFQRHFGN